MCSLVYDKAKYHSGGDYPTGLPDTQAMVHTGLYLGWIVDRGLYSQEFESESGDLIERFKARHVTGPKVYEWWDGCLVDDMLNDEGNAFTQAYFDFERGQFLTDYQQLLFHDLPSLYHVQDNWANYETLCKRIDERYLEWKTKTDAVVNAPVADEPLAAANGQPAPLVRLLKSLFSFEGRISRRTFWLLAGSFLLIMAVLGSLLEAELTPEAIPVIAFWVLLGPMIAVQVKRWHDLDKSGTWVLVNLIPVLGGLASLVVLGMVAGTPGPNRFGPAPRS